MNQDPSADGSTQAVSSTVDAGQHLPSSQPSKPPSNHNHETTADLNGASAGSAPYQSYHAGKTAEEPVALAATETPSSAETSGPTPSQLDRHGEETGATQGASAGTTGADKPNGSTDLPKIGDDAVSTDAAPNTASASASAAPLTQSQSGHLKKFTSLNVNKRFLGKASSTPPLASPTASKLGASVSPLPSVARLSSPSSASRLTSAKLSSVPKPQPAGWATKAPPAAAKMSPSLSAGSATSAPAVAGPLPSEASAASSSAFAAAPTPAASAAPQANAGGATAAGASAAAAAAAPSPQPASSKPAGVQPGSAAASPRLVTMGRDHSPRPSSAGLDSGSAQGRASPGLRNAALGSSARSASPAGVSKAPWANLKAGPSSNLAPSGRAGSMLSDFPTAAEAAKAKQEQEEKAAAAAAREAARQQAALQNLDRFRGTSLGTGKHWDEMEDEDLGEVVEFADGTQYKISSHHEDKGQGDTPNEGPVSKEDRFRDVSHDRSWPPRGANQAGASSGERPSRTGANPTLPPPAWGPQRNVREPSTQTSTADAPSRPPRSDSKPEKVIIPLAGASVSLRSPTEDREAPYAYGASRERRPAPPTSYGQAHPRAEAAGSSQARPETVTRAVRAWGPLAQRQASLNPGSVPAPPAALAPAAVKPAAVPSSSTTSAPGVPSTAPSPSVSTTTAENAHPVATPAPASSPSVAAAPSIQTPASTGAAAGRGSLPPSATAARGPSHLNRPLPPHLAQSGGGRAPFPSHEDSSFGRKTSFSPPPEPRKAVAMETSQGAVPSTRPPWGPRDASRQALEVSDPSAGQASPSADPIVDQKAEMQNAIERARKRRQEEEEARQAEKERARQKALAIEERLKAEAAKKAAEEERVRAEEARNRAALVPPRPATHVPREAVPAKLSPSAAASNWRSAREVPAAGARSGSANVGDDPRSAIEQPPTQTETWRSRGWKAQRPDGEVPSQIETLAGGRRAGQGAPPLDQRPREVPQQRANSSVDPSSFSRKLPPHLAGAPQTVAARRDDPQHPNHHVAAVSPASEDQPKRAALQRSHHAAHADASGTGLEPQQSGREGTAPDQFQQAAQPRTILTPHRRTGPASPNDLRTEQRSGSSGLRSSEVPLDSAPSMPAQESLSQQPRVILARDTGRVSQNQSKAETRPGAVEPSSGRQAPASAKSAPARAVAAQQPSRAGVRDRRGKLQEENATSTGGPRARPNDQRPSVATSQFNAVAVPKEALTTREEVPADRAPVWNRFVVSVRPSSAQPRPKRAEQKAQAARTASMSNPIRPVYPLTWEPPMTHLSIKTLSRDDQFFPKKYHRGTVITPVKLPTRTLPRGLPAIVFPPPSVHAGKANGAGVRKQARFDVSPVQQSSAPALSRLGAAAGAVPSSLAFVKPSDPMLSDGPKAAGLHGPTIQVRLPGQLPPAQSAGEAVIASAAAEPSSFFARSESQRNRDEVGTATQFPNGASSARVGVRSPFRAALTAATSQSSLGPLDHPRNGVTADGSALGSLSHSPGAGFRQKQRRSSNTPVAFYSDRQVSTPSPVSFMVNSEIKADGNAGLGNPGLSPFAVDNSGRSSTSQTAGSAQNSVLPSPNLSTSATWGQSSLTFPVIEPRTANSADRDHIKNVWSLPAGNGRTEMQNSLKDIGDDFLPSAMPLSVHDFRADDSTLPEGSDGHARPHPRGGARGARHPESGFNHYTRYDQGAGTSEGPSSNADLSPVGTRSNGFDPTTRSPSLDIASPSGAHPRASGPGGSHSQGSTPQHRTSSAFMSLQPGGNSTSSPTLQPYGPSAASALHPQDRGQSMSAAAAAAAARNAFGAYGGYAQTQSSLGGGGGRGESPSLPGYTSSGSVSNSMAAGGAGGAGSSHGRPPFGSYGTPGAANSAPVSPYNGMSRLSSNASASAYGHGSGGYSLFPTGGPTSRADVGGAGSGAGSVAGLGVLDSAGMAGEPIGYGRNHIPLGTPTSRSHGPPSHHQPPQQLSQPHHHQHAAEGAYAGYSGHWSGANYGHAGQADGGERGFQASGHSQRQQHQQHQQQQQHHHQQQQQHGRQHAQQHQQQGYGGGQQLGGYGSGAYGAFDSTPRLW